MLNNEASREALKKAKRIVIKVGTSTITYANGKRNFSQIDRLAREISDLQNQGKEMILVTSGAVAVGVDRMGLPGKPKTIPGKQAAAAVGQGVLMHTYEKFFADYGQIVAQVLITKTEAIDRHRYTNTRNTFMELMRQRVIPIVNENDVVALDELKIGDNDNMSALVAGIVDADLVIILSDVDGLYTANPQTHPDAVIVPQGEELGTLFVSRENRLQFRKRWLAFGAKIAGSIVVDDGCAKAIRKAGGCSILPAGVFAVQGEFLPGSTVSVIDKDAHELARGLVHYSSAELEQIKGCNSGEIANILGHKNFDEVIHRDDLVIL